MKKIYIKPTTEEVTVTLDYLLQNNTSGVEDNQNDYGGTGAKDHKGWSFDEDDSGTNAWGDSFSAWE